MKLKGNTVEKESWPTRDQINDLLDHDATISDVTEKLSEAVDMALSLRAEVDKLKATIAEFEICARSIGA